MRIKKLCLFTALLATATGLLTSCSVAVAARTQGTSIEKVQTARTRGQMLAHGATVISSDRGPSGELIEVYQFKKESGSAARAFMHGLLDLSTCGAWEVIGTPVEACLANNTCYTIRVYYDYQEFVSKIELL